MRKIREKILKTIDPTTMRHPIFERMAAHEARMATDPEIQRRRAEEAKVIRRERAMIFISTAVLVCAIWGGISHYLPGLVSTFNASMGALATLVILAMVLPR